MNQNMKILEVLKEGKTITPLDALNFAGCFRLSERIRELEQSGYMILHLPCKLENGKRVMSYKLLAETLKVLPDGQFSLI
jgi:hypothetical protein